MERIQPVRCYTCGKVLRLQGYYQQNMVGRENGNSNVDYTQYFNLRQQGVQPSEARERARLEKETVFYPGYLDLLNKNYTAQEAFEELGLRRYCCRARITNLPLQAAYTNRSEAYLSREVSRSTSDVPPSLLEGPLDSLAPN